MQMTNHSIHQPNLNVIASKAKIEEGFEQAQIKSKNQQTSLSSGDKVYLYDDTTYTGTLIHPIERTSPPRWTVQLDRGGYEAVNIQDITVTEPQSVNHNYPEELEIPFSNSPETPPKHLPILKTETKTPEELEQKIRILENTISQLEAENQLLEQKSREIKKENEILKKDLECAKQVIRRAKDVSPVMRLSLKRVLRLAHHACMDVQKTVGGWILKMGDKARRFRRLIDVWDVLSVDEFILSEIFPPEKLIDVNLIQPPKPRTRPIPSRFQIPKSPFPITREDLLRERELSAIA
jgi:hypothetical protein